VWSGHVPSWADFITTTPELKFSVHTGGIRALTSVNLLSLSEPVLLEDGVERGINVFAQSLQAGRDYRH
jgi:hypothetical protein